MTNYEIADQFSLLSKLMDIHGENSFKVKSYSIAAYNIEQLPSEIATMSNQELFGMKGIGESTGKKILEMQATGQFPALVDILERTPPGILDLLQIKGLGPKKIAVIWKELEIESIGELEYACNENRLVTLKGFGAKTQDSILQSIAYMRQNEGYYLWSEADVTAQVVLDNCRKALPDFHFATTGDFFRQTEIIKTIDIVTTAPLAAITPLFEGMEGVNISLTTEECYVSLPFRPVIHFINSTLGHFGTTVFEHSGSEAFMTAFKDTYQLPDTADESDIFAANNLAYIPPALRETPEILQAAISNALPTLITKSDIRGIIHAHSKWSDGNNTIEEMAIAARDKGYEYLVMSDHSQSAYYASGLKPDRIAAQHIEIDALNQKLAPFRIFKSIESDILNDGSLDYTDQVLATFDLVIASVHSNLKMSQEKAMARVMAAIENPYTTILGHPTGRLLLSRKGYPLDHKVIIDACVTHKVVIEINAHPRRLDLDWRWVAYAVEKGALLSINPDSHSINGYDDVYYGTLAAQKGGLTAERNLSSFTLAELERYIAEVRKAKGV